MYQHAAKTFGVRTPLVSTVVGLISIVQSAALLLYFGELISYLSWLKSTDSGVWNHVMQEIPKAKVISILAILMATIKLVFSLVLVFGQFYKSPGCFIAYLLASLICFIGNLFVASVGFNRIWTHKICIAILVLVVFDKIGMIAILVIIIKMNARSYATGRDPSPVSAPNFREVSTPTSTSTLGT